MPPITDSKADDRRVGQFLPHAAATKAARLFAPEHREAQNSSLSRDILPHMAAGVIPLGTGKWQSI